MTQRIKVERKSMTQPCEYYGDSNSNTKVNNYYTPIDTNQSTYYNQTSTEIQGNLLNEISNVPQVTPFNDTVSKYQTQENSESLQNKKKAKKKKSKKIVSLNDLEPTMLQKPSNTTISKNTKQVVLKKEKSGAYMAKNEESPLKSRKKAKKKLEIEIEKSESEDDQILTTGLYQFTGDMYGNLTQWYAEDMTLYKEWGQVHKSQINFMVITPDRQYLFTQSSDGYLNQWDISSGECVFNYGKANVGSAHSMAITPCSEFLFTTGDKIPLRQWSIDMNEIYCDFYDGFNDQIKCMTIAPKGEFLFMGGENSSLIEWSISKQKILKKYPKLGIGAINCLVFFYF